MTISFLDKRITPVQKPQILAVQQNMQFDLYFQQEPTTYRGAGSKLDKPYVYPCFKTEYSYEMRQCATSKPKCVFYQLKKKSRKLFLLTFDA